MNKFKYLLTAIAALTFISCGDGLKPDDGPDPAPEEKPVVKPDAASGITFSPEAPDADQPCTIYFNPTRESAISSALFNCTTDIYAHIGVFYDEEWKFVQAAWTENTDKCRLEKLGDNSYKLELGPTLREFFGSGTTPLEMVALVIRNADGTKQTKPDQFFTVTDTKYQAGVFVPDPVVNAAMPSGTVEGINYGSDNTSVTLAFYDRASDGSHHDYAYVIGEFSGWKREKDYMMKWDEESGCWWATLAGLDPEKEYMYQYYVGDGDSAFRIHDPYAEIVYDPWNDKYIPESTYPDLPAYPEDTKDRVSAFKISRTDYNWEVEDFRIKDENSLVIYEMLLRDFTSSGDINGALEKLDYLKELGVNAVELMPVQEFEGNDSWGYNPCSYFALDKAYGTREMYRKFVDECHKRGLAVLVDVVYNHTTGAHPYARLYWDSAKNNVSSLNSHYNVVTPHGFGVFQDINHQDPVIAEHIRRSLTYLLREYRVDGFRFDLTKGFTNNSGKDSSYDQQRVDILTGYCKHIKSVNPDAMVILEHFVDAENNALGSAGMHMWGNCNSAYTQVVAGSNVDLSYMYDPNCYRVGFMESHDEERICYGTSAAPASVKWGICGTMTSWAAPDIALESSDNAFVACNVAISADDAFKIRGNGTWNDAYNYGASVKNTKLPLDSGFSLTLGSSSQDMKAPESGTYDVWFSPDLKKVWLMTPGNKPSGLPDGSEDALTLQMRRASLAAAFCLMVPGPKMIWQFGELGYDISRDSNGGNTSRKPVKWDYLDVPQRKALHDSYASLLEFRNSNPEFFTKGAGFRSYVGTKDYEYGKFLFGEVDGRHFCLMGNFDTVTKDVTALLPTSAQWYDAFTGDVLVNGDSYTETLKPGEYRLLVNFR